MISAFWYFGLQIFRAEQGGHGSSDPADEYSHATRDDGASRAWGLTHRSPQKMAGGAVGVCGRLSDLGDQGVVSLGGSLGSRCGKVDGVAFLMSFLVRRRWARVEAIKRVYWRDEASY